MNTIFRFALSRTRGSIIGWATAIAALTLLIVPFYEPLKQQQQQLTDLLNLFPKEIMAFLGDVEDMFSAEGYLTLNFFSIAPVLLGILAVLGGSGLLASDEENGTLDLILAHPVSRTALFAGRLLAFVATLVVVLVAAWLGLIIPMAVAPLGVTAGEVALPFVSLFAVLLLFTALALLLSMVVPSRKTAASVAGLVLVASYFITSLSYISSDLKGAAQLSPLTYYQSGQAMRGLNVGWLVGLLAASAIGIGLAWWRFQRRDIRVAGEGSWRLPFVKRKK